MAVSVYETFLKGVVSKELSVHKKEEFLKMVKNLDEEGIKTFLLLIKFHELKINPTTSTLIPYEGTNTEDEITFDLEKIPTLLQNVLYKFMELHIKNKQVEKERELFSTK